MKPIKKLDAETIEDYAELKLRFDKLKKDQEEFSDRIKAYLLKRKLSSIGPKDSMFQLTLTTYPKTDVDWKELSNDFAYLLYGYGWQKKKIYKQLRKSRSKTTTVSRLEKPEVNPNYKGLK